jgi:sulfur-carrier protein
MQIEFWYNQSRMKIYFYANLRSLAGGKSIDLPLEEGCTVEQMVRALAAAYPALRSKMLDEKGELSPHIHIFVNGRDAPAAPDLLSQPLSPGDRVDIFPPIAGGAGVTIWRAPLRR